MPSQKKLTAQQQRDKRAKLLLAVLGVVLLAVVGFEVPSMLGGKKSPSAAAATTSASTTTGGTTTAGAPAVAAAAATPASYQVVATPQPGQLTNFSRLHAKDPFHALVAVPAGGSSTGPSTGSSTTPAKPPTTTAPATVAFSIPKTTTTTAAQAGPLVLAAVLKLNGQRRVISVGSSFPLVNPIFKLVAVGKGAIWITLVGGSFASGDQTVKIELKHPIKLVNTTADLDYLIRFMRMTAVHKALQPVTTTSATTTASTTTSASSTTTTAPTTTQ